MVVGPQPYVGSDGYVNLDGVALNYNRGTYVCREAERFGEKISTGVLTYADFNAYESSHAVSFLGGGYGLREYTAIRNPDDGIEYYDDADGIDASYGQPILAPRVFPLVLPGMTSNANAIVFVGEMRPTGGVWGGQTVVVAICEAHVFVIDSSLTITDTGITLGATAVCAAVFNGNLIIGFEGAAVAVYTSDLTATNDLLTFVDASHAGPENLYVYAIAADRSNVYVAANTAGGAGCNTVTSAVLGTNDYDPNLVTCGSSDGYIHGLAPGGGLVIVYVGKEDELGSIDATGTYRTLIPFDSQLSTNCKFLKWWMGTPGDQQRGPLVLVFPRDGNLWTYEPSSQNAGQASNLSVATIPGFRPRIPGYPTAAQGTARFLYYAITNNHTGFDTGTETMSVRIMKRDVRTGATHPYLNLGTLSAVDLPGFLDGYPALCNTMTVTSLFGVNPVLLMGYGHGLAYVILPFDGGHPLDDTRMYYTDTGTLDLPAIEMGFPDEDKIAFEIHVLSKNCSAGQREIDVYLAYDDGSFSLLGTVYESPTQTVLVTSYQAAKKIRLRFVLRSYDPQQTPQLLGFSLRDSLNPVLRRIWEFAALVPNLTNTLGGDELGNPKTTIANLWQARKDGVPVNFTDRWGLGYTVRILKMQEKEIIRNANDPPLTELSFMLLEFGRQAGSWAYDDSATVYDAEEGVYG